MQKRSNFFYIFLLFILLTGVVFFLSEFNFLKFPSSIISSLFSPLQSAAYSVSNIKGESKEVSDLKLENENLREELSKRKSSEEDLKALRDQFENSYPSSLILISADVIGSPNFVPGVTIPTSFILNKGERDGVRMGQAVIIKNNLIGIVSKTLNNTSSVRLITNPDLSFTAETEIGITGVIKGDGSKDIILDNVVLSEKIEIEDLILTRGDVEESGKGIYPNLIIGKVSSIDKKESSLFQRAKIQTLIDISKISRVFIVSN